MITQQNPAWRSGRPQQAGGSHACNQVATRPASLANGMCTALSPMGVGVAVNSAAGALRTNILRRPCVRVHFTRAVQVLHGPPPPSGGGDVRVQVVSPPALLLTLSRAPVLWASRVNGRPTDIRPTVTSTRVPELVQVATRYSLLRGFPRSREASWVPTYTCYLSIGRDTHREVGSRGRGGESGDVTAGDPSMRRSRLVQDRLRNVHFYSKTSTYESVLSLHILQRR